MAVPPETSCAAKNCAEHPGECAATLPYQNAKDREDQAVDEFCIEFLSDPEPTIITPAYLFPQSDDASLQHEPDRKKNNIFFIGLGSKLLNY